MADARCACLEGCYADPDATDVAACVEQCPEDGSVAELFNDLAKCLGDTCQVDDGPCYPEQ
jgi:hypothetical protein